LRNEGNESWGRFNESVAAGIYGQNAIRFNVTLIKFTYIR
jgi:hypothetical protein